VESSGLPVWIGLDKKEQQAWDVACESLLFHSSLPLAIQGLSWEFIPEYDRPQVLKNGKAWDTISNAPMSTSHALARFWVPYLQDYNGWALFTDGDTFWRKDVGELFALRNSKYAVMVVQHHYAPTQSTKKDGDIQTQYTRKNWSSVCLWNCGHPSNKILSPGYLNGIRGLDLHQFCWLNDKHIGQLPEEWNWLVNHSNPLIDPALVHFTEGMPYIEGHENDPYAEEWRAASKVLALPI